MVDPESSPQAPPKMQAKLARMQNAVRMGGKGTMRRKKKLVHRAAPTDEKRLTTAIKKLNLTPIPKIEEVNMFHDNGQVTSFVQPKVQAHITGNTYVISGANETKPLQDMLPNLINQLGPDNIKNIKSIMEQMGVNEGGEGAGGEGDEDVPELLDSENFEQAAESEKKEGESAEAAEANPEGEDQPTEATTEENKEEEKPQEASEA
eukprot:Plantae.Rhodophyta-Purpureofilum_apyrenoidigerum.ctg9365.p1 GENE.Plantae.Rhodophyta-Purpureofilum_apyrenoidigerum.ctg9365~~Plantae.Rhodophyta-Purpureofilum_apyrenoidigerum.ctg9365.p1  ORF type:complete len:206 (-),score=63.62 Plantae.Rhodophyta-Purpureofilum_apyrenoidigerum.ctg9365:238-855(-)